MKIMPALFIALFGLFPVCAYAIDQSRVDGAEPHGQFLGPRSAKAPQKAASQYHGLSDAMHIKFMDNENYALADALLNSAWQACKSNMSAESYRQLQAEQRKWLNDGRDSEAALLMERMNAAEAYATVIRARADFIASLISSERRTGEYENADGKFTASSNGENVVVAGDATMGMNVCDFDGHGTAKPGWIVMRHEGLDDFYVLFTAGGANIVYAGGRDQGCGLNVSFEGAYRRVRK